MRKHLNGILAAVVLCIWKAEKTDAQPLDSNPDIQSLHVHSPLHLFKQFYLYNDAEMSYHVAQIGREERLRILWSSARKYIQRHPYPLVPEDEKIRQHVYINSLRQRLQGDEHDRTVSKQIMLNAFHTVEAYFTAVNYRVCAFFYGNININRQKSDECFKLSSYMEWYFSFMFEEKVQDFCNIKMYYSIEIERPNQLKAENMCKILGKLNLDFLKFPDNPTIIPLLQDDDNNVYNPDELSMHDSDLNDEKRFISIFERYQAYEKRENQSQDDYEKTEYDKIRNSITNVYTDNFAILLNYFSQVTTEISLPLNIIKYTIPEFESMKIMWNYAPTLLQIKDLPTEFRRSVPFFSNDGNMSVNGETLYRSNALGILRQIAFYSVLQTFFDNSEPVIQIIRNINRTGFRCLLFHASPHLSVDYYFQIIMNDQDIEFVNQNLN